MIDKKTALSLDSETVNRMKRFKAHNHESMNNVLSRLLLKHGGKKNE